MGLGGVDNLGCMFLHLSFFSLLDLCFDLRQHLQCLHLQVNFIEHGLNIFPLHEPKAPFTFAHGAAGETWNMEERMERVR